MLNLIWCQIPDRFISALWASPSSIHIFNIYNDKWQQRHPILLFCLRESGFQQLLKHHIQGLFEDFPGPIIHSKFKDSTWIKVNYCYTADRLHNWEEGIFSNIKWKELAQNTWNQALSMTHVYFQRRSRSCFYSTDPWEPWRVNQLTYCKYKQWYWIMKTLTCQPLSAVL